MQYGAHIYIFTERWADDQLWVLDTARQLGLDLVELSVGDDVVFTPQLTRARAEALGLTLTVGPGGAWPVNCDLSADAPEDRAAGLAWHMRQVDLAAELGAVAYAGALYGHPGVIKRRRPPVDEYVWTAAGLHALSDYAQRAGVKIVLEPMSHFRTHVVNTPQQLMRLITLADHPNLYALFDTYHLITEVRNYGDGIRALASRLWCVHPCENDRGVPGGGLVPWDDVFDALYEIGFDGPLTMEAYNSSSGEFAYQRSMFHNVCADGEAFVRQGLGFLQGHVARRWGKA
jgi:D-psicose/D-tagatose/L-ribulose 3-epimerase